MKRLLSPTCCLAVLLGALALPASAQRRYGPMTGPSVKIGPSGGFKLGALVSMPQGAGLRTLPPGGKSVTFHSSYGFIGGGVFAFRFLPEASAQLEALVSRRGFKRTYVLTLAQRQEELTVSQLCLDLPLLARYHLNEFYAEVGVVSSLVLSTTYKQRITIPNEQLDSSGDLADARRFGMGAALGIGLEMEEGYLFGLRYVHGLSKLGNSNASTAETTDAFLRGEKLTAFSFQLTAGYLFGHQAAKFGGPLRHQTKKRSKH